MRHRSCLLFLVFSLTMCKVWSRVGTGEGPMWVEEPPSKLWFIGRLGGSVPCRAQANPPPSLEWFTTDGGAVSSIQGIREVLPNNTLHFLPLRDNMRHSDIHNSTYYCMATNSFGSIVSREVHVRLVLEQPWTIRVYDQYVLEGNTAVLRCEVPSFVADFVTVTSWARGHINYYPRQDQGDRIQMIPSGQLIIHNVTSLDHQMALRCRAVHTLTGETIESVTAAHIYVTEARTDQVPTAGKFPSVLRVQKGSPVSLVCPVSGYPPPVITWQKGSSREGRLYKGGAKRHPSLESSSSLPFQGRESLLLQTLEQGALLSIGAVKQSDSGVYTCTAKNRMGVAYHQVTLEVLAPLSARVTPSTTEVSSGGRASFTCVVDGSPVNSMKWIKDGRPLQEGRNIHFQDKGRKLVVSSVTSAEEGIYQCRASGHFDSALGSAILYLGDTPPVFLYQFIEQTMQPGPSVSLKCIATGSPTPSLSWTHDGYTLDHNERMVRGQFVGYEGEVISHVNISSVSPLDGGIYSCLARNRVGSVLHSARLNVYGAPVVRQMDDVYAVAGETLLLHCPVGGFPIDGITWQKGTQDLPLSRRQLIYANGTLAVRNVQPKTDRGTYKCKALGRSGRTSSQPVKVHVLVPPRILPFPPEHDLRQGSQLTLACSVTEGDLPLNFEWLLNDEVLDGKSNIVINKLRDMSSVLSIDDIAKQDAGKYTCQVSNSAATVTISSYIFVQVPPQWISEPKDTDVLRGQSTMLQCNAEGFPEPTITWRKVQENNMGSFQDLSLSNNGIEIFSNGSLFISEAEERHSGKYLCEAGNSIGAGLSKVLQINVQAPPRMIKGEPYVKAGIGTDASLFCSSSGDRPLELSWYKDGRLILPGSSFKFDLGNATKEHEKLTKSQLLIVKEVDRNDAGKYACTATNVHGSDSRVITLLILEAPERLRSMRVVMKTSRTATLAWQPPKDGNSPITKYTLKYSTRSDSDHTTKKLVIEDASSSVNVTDLLPDSNYVFFLTAHNEIGESKESEALQLKTEGEAPEGPPKRVKVKPSSSSALIVSWNPPDKSVSHGAITAYKIGFRRASKNDRVYEFRTADPSGLPNYAYASCCSYELSDLTPYREYGVVVRAVNAHGEGPLSKEVHATTLEDVPLAAPSGFVCSSLTSKSIYLSWQNLDEKLARGKIQNYKIVYYQNNEAAVPSKIHKTTSLGITLKNLRPFTNYSLQISALTSAGEGPQSPMITCATEEDVPGPPADVKWAMSRKKSVVISWLPPKQMNGKILTYFLTITAEGQSKKHVIKYPTSLYDLSLEEYKKPFYVSISASTRIGSGQPTDPVLITLSRTVPAAIISWGKSVSLHLSEDTSLRCDAVGIPTPNRDWLRNGNLLEEASKRAIKTYHDGSLVIRNALQKDSGNYTCTVSNEYGNDSITYSLVVQVPPSPPTAKVIDATTDSLTILWSVENNGGAPLLEARISYKEEYGEWKEEVVHPSVSKHQLRQLSCGNLYQIFVTAFNKVGAGQPSKTLSFRTVGEKPIPDKSHHLVSANSSSASIRLDGWRSGGCPIHYYGVSYRMKSANTWIIVSEQVKNRSSVEVSGLKSETHYIIRITAKNSAGTTSMHYSIMTLSSSGDVPIPKMVSRGISSYFLDLEVILPLVASLCILMAACVFVGICLRRRPRVDSKKTHVCNSSEIEDHMSYEYDKTKEHFYATIKKASPPVLESHPDEIAPEFEEEIQPYAAFQLERDHLHMQYQLHLRQQQLPQQQQQAHHHHMQQQHSQQHHSHQQQIPNRGPPLVHPIHEFPPAKSQRKSHHALRIQAPLPNHKGAETQQHHSRNNFRQHRSTPTEYLGQFSHSKSSGALRPIKSESDEYDTFGSDSEVESIAAIKHIKKVHR